MYFLKQQPLKSSTPPCLSSSPQLLCSHLPNPFFVQPQLSIRPTLAQMGESPCILKGPRRRGFGVVSLQQCCLNQQSQYSKNSPIWVPKSTQSDTVYHHVFSVLCLNTPFFPLSEPLHPSIRCLCLSIPSLTKALSCVCDPFVASLCLAACRGGKELGKVTPQALAASRPSCLSMDEKDRQICLWFKVHPGNYSE